MNTTTHFYEKAWTRKELVPYDEIWAGLSAAARREYLKKAPPAGEVGGRSKSVAAKEFEAEPLAELLKAGLLAVEEPKDPKAKPVKGARAIIQPSTARGFHLRMRFAEQLGDGTPFIHWVPGFFERTSDRNFAALYPACRAAGVKGDMRSTGIINLMINAPSWPDWVVKAAALPAGAAVLKALDRESGPLRAAELLAAASPGAPEKARGTVDALIGHLALVELLHPETLEIIVGFPPVVKRRRDQFAGRISPEDAICEKPSEIAPRASLIAGDVRELVLECAAEPLRVKRDRSLFVSDQGRVFARFVPRPAWMEAVLDGEPEERCQTAVDAARRIGLIDLVEIEEGKEAIQITAKASKWLALNVTEQTASLFPEPPKSKPTPEALERYFGIETIVVADPKPVPYGQMSYGDGYRLASKMDLSATRAAIRRALGAMPIGKFVRLDGVDPVVAPVDPCFLACGKPIASTRLLLDGIEVPGIPELLRIGCMLFLARFICTRLAPYDAMRVGLTSDGVLCVARTPLTDVYLGYKPTETVEDDVAEGPTKVVVQPDFSVVVIGLNAAPLVDLQPFCERAAGPPTPGATTFKITKESVLQAASAGLSAAQILERLNRHASVPVPDNVARQVKDWAAWIRKASARAMLVIECEDEEAASRAASSLGKLAVRLGPKAVGLPGGKLPAADRKKLSARGVVLQSVTQAAAQKKPKAKPGGHRPTSSELEAREILEMLRRELTSFEDD